MYVFNMYNVFDFCTFLYLMIGLDVVHGENKTLRRIFMQH